MTKILFICHGNICRSTMAESVMTYLVNLSNLGDVEIDSAATSREEIGNPPHPGTKAKLREMNIPCIPHRARQVTREDIEKFDLIICMDEALLQRMGRMFGKNEKFVMLLDSKSRPLDIADPWYTGDFDRTFDDVWEGCNTLLDTLEREKE